jgi:hypothetical protein
LGVDQKSAKHGAEAWTEAPIPGKTLNRISNLPRDIEPVARLHYVDNGLA